MARVATLATTDDDLIVWYDLGASNHIANGDFASDTLWTKADFTITGGKAVYLHSAGNGSLFQSNANMAIALVAGRKYRFTYTISEADAQGGHLFLTRFDVDAALGFVTIPATDGTHIVDFVWPAGKNGFAFGVWSNTAGATFKIDDISMIDLTAGETFDGVMVAKLEFPTGYTTAQLQGDVPGLRLPVNFPVPIKDGVYDQQAKLLWTSAIQPPGTNYVPEFYDLHGTLIATGSDFTIDDDTEEYILDPPTLEAP